MRLSVFIIILFILLTLPPMYPLNPYLGIKKALYNNYPRLNYTDNDAGNINPMPSGEKIEFFGSPIDQLWYNSSSIIIFEHGFIYKGDKVFCWNGNFTDFVMTDSSFYVLYSNIIKRHDKILYFTIWVFNRSKLVLRDHLNFTNISAGDLDGDGSDDIVLWRKDGNLYIIYSNGNNGTINISNVEISDLWIWNNTIIFANKTQTSIRILGFHPGDANPEPYNITFTKIVYADSSEEKISFYGVYSIPYLSELYKNGSTEATTLDVEYIDKCVKTNYGFVFYNESGFTYYNGTSWNFDGSVYKISYSNGKIVILNDTITVLDEISLKSEKHVNQGISLVYYNSSLLGLTKDGRIYNISSEEYIGFLKGVGKFRLKHYYDRVILYSDHDVVIVSTDSEVKHLWFDESIENVFVSDSSTIIKTEDGYIHLLNGSSFSYPNATFAYISSTNRLLIGLRNGTLIDGKNKFYFDGEIVFITNSSGDLIVASAREEITDTRDLAVFYLTIHNLTSSQNITIDLKCDVYSIQKTNWSLSIINYENILFGTIVYEALFQVVSKLFLAENYTFFVIDSELHRYKNYTVDSEVIIEPFWGIDKPVFKEVTADTSDVLVNRFMIYDNDFLSVKYEGEIPVWASLYANLTNEKLRYLNTSLKVEDASFILSKSDRIILVKNGEVYIVPLEGDSELPEIIYLGKRIFSTNDVNLSFKITDNMGLKEAKVFVANQTFYYELSGNSSYISLSIELEEGEYNISVSVLDIFRNEKRIDFKIVVDTSPPLITLIYPQNGTAIKNKVLTPIYEVNDVSNVTVTIYVDEKLYNGEELSEGIHYLEIIANDSLGRKAEVSAYFKVDTQAPQISLVNFSDYYNTTRIPIIIHVNEECSLTIKIDGSIVEVNSTVELEEGLHEISIKATDEAGNVAELRREFIIDLRPPKIGAKPANKTVLVGSVNLSINVTDDYGVSYMIAYLDKNVIYEGNYTENLSIELKDGIHEIIIIAFDFAGNKGICHFYLKAVKGISVFGVIIDYGTLSFMISFVTTLLIFIAYKKRERILKLLRWIPWRK